MLLRIILLGTADWEIIRFVHGGIKRETQQRLQGRAVMAYDLTANSIPDLASSMAG